MGDKQEEGLGKWTLYMVMLLCLFLGAFQIILLKLQDEVYVTRTGKFNHPFFQTAVMFFGEFMCLGIYYIRRTVPSMRNKDD